MTAIYDGMTPMMMQYQKLKTESPDALLFFRLGDFYEMFGDDAIEAAKLLDITLTARSSGEGRNNKIPMCGVPYHAVENYINRLLKQGKKVAIVEQMEDPRKVKGMVKRELIRIITPGTVLSSEGLNAKQNNYLLAIAGRDHNFGLATADLSTGEFLVTELKDQDSLNDIIAEVSRIKPVELLMPDDFSEEIRKKMIAATQAYPTILENFRFDPDAGQAYLKEMICSTVLDHSDFNRIQIGFGAAAALVYYLVKTQRGSISHIKKLHYYSIHKYMRLDSATIRNLELISNATNGDTNHTLLNVLDFSNTSMGSRKLRQWIVRPLVDRDSILKRQMVVAEFVEKTALRLEIKTLFGKMHDLERLCGKIGSGTVNPRELFMVGVALKLLPEIKNLFKHAQSEYLREIYMHLPECSDTAELINCSIHEQPPVTLKDGGVIKPGYNREVDEYRRLTLEGKETIAIMQMQERQKTGISNLKIHFNNVFGYYIEVSKGNTKLVPDYYQRKQTLVNAERYITPELKEYEEKVLGAEEKLIELENELFVTIRNQVANEIQAIQMAADMISSIDALYAFSESAVKNNYSQPTLCDDDKIEIVDGRHPIVELICTERFIPNDTHLNKTDNKVIIITGPNMAGKSTYLRQNALIVIMAQVGSFVPAKQAILGIVDRVFTRVGASDNLAAGHSTFMVEMIETATILKNATSRSLVILDEVGRGTSTFDGISIAWAVAEYLHDQLNVKTLFATHYYELTELALSKNQIKNFNIAVKEWKESIVFLRKIVPGSADRSYGIHVARLAELPNQVLERAKEILINLENANYTNSGKSRLAEHSNYQMIISNQEDNGDFIQKNNSIIKSLEKINLDILTPLDALNLIASWKNELL